MYAQNAISAKCRAMFAKHLRQQHYQELMQCANVNQAAAYLKSRTYYGDYIGQGGASDVRRGWLEERLRASLFQKHEALSHYNYTLGDRFYRYFLIQGEIRQIIRCATLLHAQGKELYLLSLPPFFAQQSDVDFAALSRCGTCGEFLSVLESTPYYDICRKWCDPVREQADVQSLSHALDEYGFHRLFELIKTSAKGAQAQELYAMAQMQVDVYNIRQLYRAARMRQQDVAPVRAQAILDLGALDDRQLQRIFQAGQLSDVVDMIKKSPYKQYIKRGSYAYIEHLTSDILYHRCIRELRYSSCPLVALLAYASLSILEVDNLIHVIEGIRYGQSPQTIQELLVGVS
ncbi:MAG: V-type ATPase subunit [Clostridiales bacterium]|nr:V-type ATPase subunit [Clostridiales bacterium]